MLDDIPPKRPPVASPRGGARPWGGPAGALGIVRRYCGIAGTVLLGVALALAPILAFQGGMTYVSGIGIAGIALLIVYRLLPRPPAEAPPGEDRP